MRDRIDWSYLLPPVITGAGFLTIVYIVSSTASGMGMTSTESQARTPDGPPPAQTGLSFAVYRNTVEPILLEDRGGNGPGVSACVTCHVQSATSLTLQPLQEDESGAAYWTEAQSRMNFEIVSALVTPGEPDRSRLLLAPLARSAGGSAFHGGGKFWDSHDHPDWQTLAAWVRTVDAGSGPAIR